MTIISLSHAIWFGYIYKPVEDRGDVPIPLGSIVFLLGFEHFEENSIIKPGLANEYLALWAEKNAENISLVITQKSISQALNNPKNLKNGTPVYQMHDHRRDLSPVRTLEALACALERFRVPPKAIVLTAHPKHYERALADFRFLYPECEIINPHLAKVPYRDRSFLSPFLWAYRELYFARPLEFLQRQLNMVKCRDGVKLEKIDRLPNNL